MSVDPDKRAACPEADKTASLSSHGEPREKKKKNLSVRFPDENQLVTEYFEPANPWHDVPTTSRAQLAQEYLLSCRHHNTAPIDSVLEQIRELPENSIGGGVRAGRLALADCSLEGAAPADALESLLRKVQFRRIELDHAELDDEGAEALFDMIEYYESATVISITGPRQFGIRGWQAACRMIKKSAELSEIEVAESALEPSHAPVLARALRPHTCRLRALCLQHARLSGEALMCLVIALKSNSSIRELRLPDNSLTPQDAQQLGSLLKFNTNIQLLDLSNNLIQDAGVGHIANALEEQAAQTPPSAGNSPISPQLYPMSGPESRGLAFLVLWNNQLTRNCAPHLSKALMSSHSLCVLNIGRNALGAELVRALQSGCALRRSALASLGLQSARLGPEAAAPLAALLRDSTKLQRLDLRDNRLGAAALHTIRNAMKQNHTLTQMDLDEPPESSTLSEDSEAATIARLVAEIASYCRRNEPAQSEVKRRAHRKISLTCQTAQSCQQAVSSSRLCARLRSPLPSPAASPAGSPVPHHNVQVNRFSVTRVTPERESTDSSICGTRSRFKVMQVAEPPQIQVHPAKRSRFSVTRNYDSIYNPSPTASPSPSPTPPAISPSPSVSPCPSDDSPRIDISSSLNLQTEDRGGSDTKMERIASISSYPNDDSPRTYKTKDYSDNPKPEADNPELQRVPSVSPCSSDASDSLKVDKPKGYSDNHQLEERGYSDNTKIQWIPCGSSRFSDVSENRRIDKPNFSENKAEERSHSDNPQFEDRGYRDSSDDPRLASKSSFPSNAESPNVHTPKVYIDKSKLEQIPNATHISTDTDNPKTEENCHRNMLQTGNIDNSKVEISVLSDSHDTSKKASDFSDNHKQESQISLPKARDRDQSELTRDYNDNPEVPNITNISRDNSHIREKSLIEMKLTELNYDSTKVDNISSVSPRYSDDTAKEIKNSEICSDDKMISIVTTTIETYFGSIPSTTYESNIPINSEQEIPTSMFGPGPIDFSKISSGTDTYIVHSRYSGSPSITTLSGALFSKNVPEMSTYTSLVNTASLKSSESTGNADTSKSNEAIIDSTKPSSSIPITCPYTEPIFGPALFVESQIPPTIVPNSRFSVSPSPVNFITPIENVFIKQQDEKPQVVIGSQTNIRKDYNINKNSEIDKNIIQDKPIVDKSDIMQSRPTDNLIVRSQSIEPETNINVLPEETVKCDTTKATYISNTRIRNISDTGIDSVNIETETNKEIERDKDKCEFKYVSDAHTDTTTIPITLKDTDQPMHGKIASLQEIRHETLKENLEVLQKEKVAKEEKVKSVTQEKEIDNLVKADNVRVDKEVSKETKDINALRKIDNVNLFITDVPIIDSNKASDINFCEVKDKSITNVSKTFSDVVKTEPYNDRSEQLSHKEQLTDNVVKTETKLVKNSVNISESEKVDMQVEVTVKTENVLDNAAKVHSDKDFVNLDDILVRKDDKAMKKIEAITEDLGNLIQEMKDMSSKSKKKCTVDVDSVDTNIVPGNFNRDVVLKKNKSESSLESPDLEVCRLMKNKLVGSPFRDSSSSLEISGSSMESLNAIENQNIPKPIIIRQFVESDTELDRRKDNVVLSTESSMESTSEVTPVNSRNVLNMSVSSNESVSPIIFGKNKKIHGSLSSLEASVSSLDSKQDKIMVTSADSGIEHSLQNPSDNKEDASSNEGTLTHNSSLKDTVKRENLQETLTSSPKRTSSLLDVPAMKSKGLDRMRKISWVAPSPSFHVQREPEKREEKPSHLEKLLSLFQHPTSLFSRSQSDDEKKSASNTPPRKDSSLTSSFWSWGSAIENYKEDKEDSSEATDSTLSERVQVSYVDESFSKKLDSKTPSTDTENTLSEFQSFQNAESDRVTDSTTDELVQKCLDLSLKDAGNGNRERASDTIDLSKPNDLNKNYKIGETDIPEKVKLEEKEEVRLEPVRPRSFAAILKASGSENSLDKPVNPDSEQLVDKLPVKVIRGIKENISPENTLTSSMTNTQTLVEMTAKHPVVNALWEVTVPTPEKIQVKKEKHELAPIATIEETCDIAADNNIQLAFIDDAKTDIDVRSSDDQTVPSVIDTDSKIDTVTAGLDNVDLGKDALSYLMYGQDFEPDTEQTVPTKVEEGSLAQELKDAAIKEMIDLSPELVVDEGIEVFPAKEVKLGLSPVIPDRAKIKKSNSLEDLSQRSEKDEKSPKAKTIAFKVPETSPRDIPERRSKLRSRSGSSPKSLPESLNKPCPLSKMDSVLSKKKKKVSSLGKMARDSLLALNMNEEEIAEFRRSYKLTSVESLRSLESVSEDANSQSGTSFDSRCRACLRTSQESLMSLDSITEDCKCLDESDKPRSAR